MKSKNLFAALALGLSLSTLALSAAAAEAGKDYQSVSPAQPTETRGKVEVLEFFWYKCPHCLQFEPDISPWAKKLPKDVVFKRQPAILGDAWAPMARVFYTLETLGAVDKLHGDVFEAVQTQGVNLDDPATFFDWAAKQGLDRAKVKDAYESFGVGMKVARAKQLTRAYKLNGVPTMTVNGKYTTSASLTGGHEKTLEVVDALIEQERKGGKR